eukprot:TRINITY_DN11647_c0_g1_i1.p1 TRINITY_DN11647_c0_g1~~TRINITY_DN11647_c0_g1_i1.p1  ORF type:complete len:230 (+),score=62.66 TRINITY_DN11647_c0_g1_i1:104-691(+)
MWWDHPEEVDDGLSTQEKLLFHAALQDRGDSACRLLAEGVWVSPVDASDGSTPLHIAVRCGSLSVMRELLANGAKLELRDATGATPLWLAVDKGDLEALGELIGRGADPEAPGRGGQSPLYRAVQRVGCAEVASALLAAGADPDRPGASEEDDETPYALARRTCAAAFPFIVDECLRRVGPRRSSDALEGGAAYP